MQVSAEGLSLDLFEQHLMHLPEAVPFDHASFVLAGMRGALQDREAALLDSGVDSYWADSAQDIEEVMCLSGAVAMLEGSVGTMLADEAPVPPPSNADIWVGPTPRYCSVGRRTKPITRLRNCAFQ